MAFHTSIGRRWIKLVVLGAAAAVSCTGALKAEIPAGAPIVTKYTAPNGKSFFAIAVQAEALPGAAAESRDHVVLFDTSASQAGDHRKQALAVLKAFLSSLPNDDRVSVMAVDVAVTRMHDGFAAANDSTIDKAVASLQRRVPLGATDLRAGIAAALEAVDAARSGSIVYIGDGMSTAGLILPDDLSKLMGELRARRIAMSSYAVGPNTDLQLLGVLANHTGGIVLMDSGDSRREDAQTRGQRLAAAVDLPVFYPAALHTAPEGASVLPATALPMRADRATVYLAVGQAPESLTVSGSNETIQWNLAGADVRPGNALLRMACTVAEKDAGVSVPFAGAELLDAAMRMFDERVDEIVVAGERAVKARDLKKAEQFSLALAEMDPGSSRAKAVETALTGLKFHRVANAAQETPVPAEAEAQPAPPEPSTAEPPAAEPAAVEPPPAPVEPAPIVTPPATVTPDARIQHEEMRRSVRAQQLTLEASQRIEGARGMFRDDPDGAISLIKQGLDTMEASTDIDPAVRQQLLRRMQAVLQELTSQVESRQIAQLEIAQRAAMREAEQRLLEQIEADQQRLKELIDRVRALLQDAVHGRDEAYEEAEAVARAAVDLRPGDGTAAQALFTSEAAGQLNKFFRMRSLNEDRWLETLYQVELSHVPFPDDPALRYPPAEVWRALTERRKIWESVDLKIDNPAEMKIRSELSKPTEIQFTEIPLRDAIAFIAQLHDFQFLIDPAIEEAGTVSLDEPLTYSLSGITLRSALKIILEDHDLAYVIEDELMRFTTAEDANERLTTRVYPVGDLIINFNTAGGMMGGMGGGMMGGMGMGGMGGMGMGGMGGGMGGMGMGGMGMGGMGGGMGMFSVPPTTPPRPAARPASKLPTFDNAAVESQKSESQKKTAPVR